MDAELKLSAFCVEHNIPFLVIDHIMVKLQKTIFPDSQIARSIKCGRTKTTTIVKFAIADEQIENLTQLLNNNKFSIMIHLYNTFIQNPA